MPAMPSGAEQQEEQDGDHSAVARAFDAIHAALGGGKLNQAIAKREELHLTGIVSGLEGGFPTIADIEQALEQNAILPKDLRITSGRKDLDLHLYRYVNRDKIEPQMLANSALMGSSIAINRVQRRIPKAHRLAKRLEAWLGDAVELVLFASFGPSGAFDPHHDEEHLVNVQLDGIKHWTLLGAPVAPGAPMDMEEEPSPPRHLTMNPGDVLYLPPGQRHICHAEGYSVHLAIILLPPTGAVLRSRLEKALGESIVLQEPVPAILGPANDKRMADEFRSHLHGLVDKLDIEALFAQERKHLKIRPRVKLQPRKP